MYIHFNLLPIHLHLLSVNLPQILSIKYTSWKQISHLFSTQWATALLFQPAEQALPVEDVLEGVAVEADDLAAWLEIFHADCAAVGDSDFDL